MVRHMLFQTLQQAICSPALQTACNQHPASGIGTWGTMWSRAQSGPKSLATACSTWIAASRMLNTESCGREGVQKCDNVPATEPVCTDCRTDYSKVNAKQPQCSRQADMACLACNHSMHCLPSFCWNRSAPNCRQFEQRVHAVSM